MASDSLQVDCLRGFDQVDRAHWDALWQLDPQANFYQKYDWYDAWVRHFEPGSRPVILIARQGGRWLGAAALIIQSQKPLPLVSRNILTFISSFSPAYPLYQGPLVDPDHEAEVLMALAREMVRQTGFCAINFELYAADSRTEKLLRAVAQVSGKPLRQKITTHSHLIEWTGEYEAYISSLGSQTRRKVRKHSRHFLESGNECRLQVVSCVAEAQELIDSIREQKRNRFLAKGEKSNFDQDCFSDFLMDLAPWALQEGNIIGLMARIGEKIIGAQLIFHDEHGHFFSYNSSFDGDYKDLRVHYLLESERVRIALEHGYSVIDLSTGYDDHKKHWTDGRICPLLDGEVVLRPLGNLRYKAFSCCKKTIKAHME